MRRCRAFTLIELLVVVAIIGVLAAILIPVAGRVRESSHRVKCASNLRQIMAATLVYMQDNKGLMPLVHKNEDGDRSRWAVQIQDYLSNAADRSKLDSSVFICPSDAVERTDHSSTQCSYGLNVYVHVNGIASNLTRKPFVKIDNPSQTIFYGEVWNEVNTVAYSLSTGAGEMFLGDFHDGEGSNYAFADGHVEFLTKERVREDNGKLMRGIPMK